MSYVKLITKEIDLKREKIYSSLLMCGAGILLFRTIRLLTVENGWELLAIWIILFTFLEIAIDILCIIFSFQWFLRNSITLKNRALLIGAIVAIFHAFRVLIYLIGRIGPWKNFDLKPQFHQSHNVELFWVYFASVLSILGILGVIIIWLKIKKTKIL